MVLHLYHTIKHLKIDGTCEICINSSCVPIHLGSFVLLPVLIEIAMLSNHTYCLSALDKTLVLV